MYDRSYAWDDLRDDDFDDRGDPDDLDYPRTRWRDGDFAEWEEEGDEDDDNDVSDFDELHPLEMTEQLRRSKGKRRRCVSKKRFQTRFVPYRDRRRKYRNLGDRLDFAYLAELEAGDLEWQEILLADLMRDDDRDSEDWPTLEAEWHEQELYYDDVLSMRSDLLPPAIESEYRGEQIFEKVEPTETKLRAVRGWEPADGFWIDEQFAIATLRERTIAIG